MDFLLLVIVAAILVVPGYFLITKTLIMPFSNKVAWLIIFLVVLVVVVAIISPVIRDYLLQLVTSKT